MRLNIMVIKRTEDQSWKPSGAEPYRILWPVIFLTVIFFLHFITRQLTGPLLPEIELEVGLSHTQSGFFVLLMGVGFSISQLGAAFLAARWGYRRCVLLSILGSATAAILITQTETFWGLALGYIGVGIAGGLYFCAVSSLSLSVSANAVNGFGYFLK